MSLEKKNWSILVAGVVQSVGFRPFIKRLADKLGLKGYVQNLGDAGVKIMLFMATKEDVDNFVKRINEEKPDLAVILDIEIKSEESSIDKNYENRFLIIPSEKKKGMGDKTGFSALPPDISICNECIEDMKRPGRRFEYVFTSCTNCGPRYSAIIELPYDRPNTSFKNFPLCDDCLEEYINPDDRRFHAQTTCCSVCGPKYQMFLWKNNKWIKRPLNWRFVADSLKKGKIWAVMGISGTHFFLDALNQEIVSKFRNIRRKRSNKPFAVLMDSINTVKKYCFVSPEDEKLLSSVRRPIVILPVKNRELWDPVIPSLKSLGVMLPYTGIHHVLFWNEAPKALIATSANIPGIPMPIHPNGVFKVAENIAYGVLVHDRPIIQRVDDSLIRSFGKNHVIIRRSRGYVPQPLFHKEFTDTPNMLSVGAEENNTVSVFKNGWFIPSQHLGHIKNIEGLEFEKTTIQHLEKLFDIKPEVIIRDLHPTFQSSILAKEIAEQEKNIEYSVVHHVAHVASLGLDLGIKKEETILAWAVDGYGFGADGNAWGGELIFLRDDHWERRSSLIPINYLGGDLNAIYPGRMLSLYLLEMGLDPNEFLGGREEELFRHGTLELNYLKKAFYEGKRDILTTSLGRLLDSISALLGICTIRSYRGEPAMALEGVALRYEKEIDTDIFIIAGEDGTLKLDNKSILREVLEMFLQREPVDFIAKWTHIAIARSMGELMLRTERSRKQQIDYFGITGGVAYNKIISLELSRFLKEQDVKLSFHNNIPPGDAGISVGQLFFIGRVINNENTK